MQGFVLCLQVGGCKEGNRGWFRELSQSELAGSGDMVLGPAGHASQEVEESSRQAQSIKESWA